MSSINHEEVEKFSRIADEWWDENGKFKPLHKFNPIRLSYLRRKIEEKFSRISEVNILDIGCGGGLVSEPLARMGAKITAIDASEKNIAVAKIHAEKSGLEIDYKVSAAEKMTEEFYQKFDVVLALEIIEHVDNPENFLIDCAKLVKPGGLLFVATINRNLKSLALAKIAVEYVLRWLPKGTHDWKKFLKPSEVDSFAKKAELKLQELRGFCYNPLNDSWKESEDVEVNYMAVFVRN